jgi:hypothetical protein
MAARQGAVCAPRQRTASPAAASCRSMGGRKGFVIASQRIRPEVPVPMINSAIRFSWLKLDCFVAIAPRNDAEPFSISRPQSGRRQFKHVPVGIAEINAFAAARPFDPALDRNAGLGKARFPGPTEKAIWITASTKHPRADSSCPRHSLYVALACALSVRF